MPKQRLPILGNGIYFFSVWRSFQTKTIECVVSKQNNQVFRSKSVPMTQSKWVMNFRFVRVGLINYFSLYFFYLFAPYSPSPV